MFDMFIIVVLLPPTLFPAYSAAHHSGFEWCPGDFSGDASSLEEQCLLQLYNNVMGWHRDFIWGSSTPHSGQLASYSPPACPRCQQDPPWSTQSPYFPLDMRQRFLQSWVVFQMSLDGLACHGGVQPISTTAFLQRDLQICCICLEPRSSAVTMKYLG